MSSERAKAFTTGIFRLFGGVYEGAIKGLEQQAPEEIRKALALLISEARKRSGLTPEKSLRLIKYLRDVLTHIIDNEK